MKLLHTGDWHIGKILYNQDLTENFQSFFQQLVEIVRTEQPNALLICGDIFETSNPSIQAKRFFNENLLRIREVLPSMSIVVISGNHDSSQRVDVDGSLWQFAGVHVVSTIRNGEGDVDYDSHIVEIFDEKRNVIAMVGAVPFAYEQNFPVFENAENRIADFYEKLTDRMKEKNTKNAPIILMGHLSVGTNLDDGEKRMNDIGGLETVGVEKLTGQYDYWALGHIHRPQFVQGTGHRARYAGSPIALSFDEEYDHSVSIVSFDANKCVDVKTIAIDEPHKVTSIPKNPQSFDEALQLLKEYPADRQDYIRLNVWANGAPSDAMAIAQAEMNGKNSELLSINYVRDSEERKGTAVMSLSEFEDLSPLQVAKHIMRDSFSEEMEQTFMEVLASMDD